MFKGKSARIVHMSITSLACGSLDFNTMQQYNDVSCTAYSLQPKEMEVSQWGATKEHSVSC